MTNITERQILFNLVSTIKDDWYCKSSNIMPKSDLSNMYQQIGFSNKPENIVSVYPIFIQTIDSDMDFTTIMERNVILDVLW